MKVLFLRLGAMLLCGVAGLAHAQVVIQADKATLKAQVERGGAGFASCGVRGTIVTGSKDYIDSYDISLTVRANAAHGTLKAGKSRTSTRTSLKRKYSKGAVFPPPVSFWLSQENDGKVIGPKSIIPARDKGYILETSDVADTHRGIVAMIRGERMQFAVRYNNQPADIVVRFAAELPETERAPLLKCLDEVIEKISARANRDRSPGTAQGSGAKQSGVGE